MHTSRVRLSLKSYISGRLPPGGVRKADIFKQRSPTRSIVGQMTEETSEARQSYEIVSVRRSEPPSGAEGSSWYRYEIAFGGSKNIQGCRQGNLNVVTEAVEEIVAQLNERHRGKKGRVHLVPTPKKKPATPDPSKSS